MRSLAVLIALGALSGAAAEARAEATSCAGCVLLAPEGSAPAPLLVLLHGDEGSPTKIVGAWKKAAADAHVVLFAPRCPVSEGCRGSYWQWNGDPSWLLHQVELVEAAHAIDPRRRYLAGWSGGTTYATFHFRSWFPTFAAVSLAGGGAPPASSECFARAGGACAPVHYLQGDKNPLFSLAQGARTYIEGCGHEVAWELHAGADHAGEWRAYERETGAILAWLLAHPEGCAAPIDPSAPPSSATDPAASAAARPAPSVAAPTAAAPSSVETRASASATPPIPDGPRCACRIAAPADARSRAVVLALLLGALAARRAGRARRRASRHVTRRR